MVKSDCILLSFVNSFAFDFHGWMWVNWRISKVRWVNSIISYDFAVVLMPIEADWVDNLGEDGVNAPNIPKNWVYSFFLGEYRKVAIFGITFTFALGVKSRDNWDQSLIFGIKCKAIRRLFNNHHLMRAPIIKFYWNLDFFVHLHANILIFTVVHSSCEVCIASWEKKCQCDYK